MTRHALLVGVLASVAQAGPAFSGKLDCNAPESWTPQQKKMAAKVCPRIEKQKAAAAEAEKEREAKYEKFVKGHAAFEAVYASHQKRLPTSSKKKGDTVVWTYMTYVTNAAHSQCEEFVFDADGGKQLSTRTYTCD